MSGSERWVLECGAPRTWDDRRTRGIQQLSRFLDYVITVCRGVPLREAGPRGFSHFPADGAVAFTFHSKAKFERCWQHLEEHFDFYGLDFAEGSLRSTLGPLCSIQSYRARRSCSSGEASAAAR